MTKKLRQARISSPKTRRLYRLELDGRTMLLMVGLLALAANVFVAVMLFRFRDGDSDMRSVWLCSRNDAIGNMAVMAAALGVFGTGSAWPDLIVAAIMGTLAVTAGVSVVRHARADINDAKRDAQLQASET